MHIISVNAHEEKPQLLGKDLKPGKAYSCVKSDNPSGSPRPIGEKSYIYPGDIVYRTYDYMGGGLECKDKHLDLLNLTTGYMFARTCPIALYVELDPRSIIKLRVNDQ